MPTRYLLSVVLGTVLVFTWGGIGWAGGLYAPWLRPMPGGEAVVRVMADAAPGSGMYVHPAPLDVSRPMSQTEREKAEAARRDQFRRGPVIMMALTQGERDPDDATFMLRGVLIELFATAMLVAVIGLAGSGHGPLRRFLSLAAMVLFMNLGTHMVSWAFMFTPDDFTAVLMFDGIVGWTLAGLPAVFLMRSMRPGDVSAA
ncbi:MAG: hypothetical protein RLZZ558_825 [Planctomycetota bacterium]|jgi:hypothetical protein